MATKSKKLLQTEAQEASVKQQEEAAKEAEKSLEQAAKQGEEILKKNEEQSEKAKELALKEVQQSKPETEEPQRMILALDRGNTNFEGGIGPEGEAAHRANFAPEFGLVRNGDYAEVVDASGKHKIVPTATLYTQGVSPGIEVQATAPFNPEAQLREIEEKLAPTMGKTFSELTGGKEGEPVDSAPTASMVRRQHIGQVEGK